jgi:translation initiation factor eIF-2B subunit epsilon
MAPKKKAAQADKGRVEDEVEEPLQAVVCRLRLCTLRRH